jgi:hypothetical protein
MAVAQYICEAPVGDWWTATESGMWALRHKETALRASSRPNRPIATVALHPTSSFPS